LSLHACRSLRPGRPLPLNACCAARRGSIPSDVDMLAIFQENVAKISAANLPLAGLLDLQACPRSAERQRETERERERESERERERERELCLLVTLPAKRLGSGTAAPETASGLTRPPPLPSSLSPRVVQPQAPFNNSPPSH